MINQDDLLIRIDLPPNQKPYFLHIFKIIEFFFSAITDSFLILTTTIILVIIELTCLLTIISQDAKTTNFVL